jgi:hypothetical protein
MSFGFFFFFMPNRMRKSEARWHPLDPFKTQMQPFENYHVLKIMLPKILLLLNYLLALKAGLQRLDFLKFFYNDDYGTVF